MINKILEYQKYDMKMFKLEKSLEERPDRQNALKLQASIKNMENSIVKMDKELQDYNQQIAKVRQSMQEIIEKVNALVSRSNSADKQDEFDDIMVNSDKLLDELSIFEKEADVIKKKIDAIHESYAKFKEKYKDEVKKYTETKNRYTEWKKSIEPQAIEIKKALNLLEKDLHGEIFEKYKSLRNNKIMPAIVHLMGETQCGGCYMELSVGCLTKLRDNKITECENCGRLIVL